ncbi:MAG: orotate phosphoribosyltransferase-like protein [Candidatus Hydrothermarchaeaceae archaeon]
MRNAAELMEKARELKEKGFTTGEIADELNISRETALWLITRETEKREAPPKDIYIDWSNVGSNPAVLKHLSLALGELIHELIKENDLPQPDTIAGIAISGIPIATMIAEEMNASLAVIRPKKLLWEPGKGKEVETGFILSNFADVKGKNIVIVDDITTSGGTLRETLRLLQDLGAHPIAAVVMIDKKGIKTIGDTPVRALVSVGIIGE